GGGGVRRDGGGLEAEVLVVSGDLIVDGLGFPGDGRQRRGQGNLFALDGAELKDATFEVVRAGGVLAEVVGSDEEDARVVERERLRRIIGNDDADGHETVAEVVETRVGRGLLGVGGVGGDGDLLVRVVCRVLRGGKRRRDLAGLVSVGGERRREGESDEEPQLERHTIELCSGKCEAGKVSWCVAW